MFKKLKPLNLTLAKITPMDLQAMEPVTSLDMFDSPGSKDLHPEGLFSTDIFGRVGEAKRDIRFSYCDIKVKIMHPLMYRSLKNTKRFYVEIMEGKEYAKWDAKAKEFVKCSEVDGDTGYDFFMSHWNDIKFETGDSPLRQQRVEMMNRYRQQGLYDKILIMPAGMRDVEIDSTGRTKEHEINPMYRRLLSIGNTFPDGLDRNLSVYDSGRVALQGAFNTLYEHITNFLSGKNGFIESKWTSRNIIGGTRNVVSSIDVSLDDLDDEDSPSALDTVMGLWQISKGSLPLTIPRLKSALEDVFVSSDGGAYLINKKTLKKEYVQLDPEEVDRWTTPEGLEKIISSLSNIDIRGKHVEPKPGYYAKLVYKPKDKMVFRMFNSIDELPEDFDKEDVHPVTLFELIYISAFDQWNDLAVVNTRYPVNSEGSTLPSKVYMKTTVVDQIRHHLNNEWKEDEPPRRALSYPVMDDPIYIDSAKVSPFRLRAASGDYDGDMFSNNILFTKEAIDEVNKYLMSREAHVGPWGGMRGSAHNDTTEYVMFNLTGDAQ